MGVSSKPLPSNKRSWLSDSRQGLMWLAIKCSGRSTWLLVLHLAGSAQINEFHQGLNGPVSQDRLPPATEWPALLQAAGLQLLVGDDQPGLFLLVAKRA